MSRERESDVALVRSLVGRTIVDAVWYDDAPDIDWTGHEECKLTLDDGRVIIFGARGHDAWGATIWEEVAATEGTDNA